MHEFAICSNIVDSVLEEYARIEPPPGKLLKTRVVAGQMHQLVPEYLSFAYEVLTRDTPVAGSTIEIVPVPVRGRCRACGWEGEITPPLFQCDSCDEFDIETTSGMELHLDGLEIEDER